MYSRKGFNLRRRKNIYFIFFLIGVLSFFLLFRFHKAPLIVASVIDGDTVILSNGEKVRYLGIDTPECREHTKNGWVEIDQPFSLEAREFNRRLVEGKTVRLEFDKVKRDKYGRMLAYLWVDGKLVNEELLKEGLAFVFFIWPNERYANRFCSAQIEAMKSKKGLWSIESIIPPEQAPEFKDMVKLVRGRVCREIRTENALLLYLKCSTPEFKVVLPYSHFAPSGLYRYNGLEGRYISSLGKIRCSRRECKQVLLDPIQLECEKD